MTTDELKQIIESVDEIIIKLAGTASLVLFLIGFIIHEVKLL